MAMEDIQGYNTLITISSLLFAVTIIGALFGKTRTKARLPPSPFALPIIGHLHRLGPLTHRALHKLSDRQGPLIRLSLGSVPCVVASSAETAKEFLKTHESSFLNRPPPSVLRVICPSGSFSFSEFNPCWTLMKRLCVAHLFGGQALDQLLPIRREELERLLGLFLRKARANEAVDLGEELAKLSNNVMSRMIMSRRCAESEDEAGELVKAVRDTSEVIGTTNFSDYFWFLKKFDLQGFSKKGKEVHDRFDRVIEEVLKEHEDEAMKKEMGSGRVKDFVDILLEVSQDESSEIRFTKEKIKSFVLDLLISGTGTSSITTSWAMSELINNPNIMNKARQEIDSVVGTTRLVAESDIPNLPYIQAIVKETLRLHPTVPLMQRECTKSCKVNGYEIPEKTRLIVNVWAIGRDPNHWEDPLEFKPERFLSEEGIVKSGLDVRGQNFSLLPFGSGRRSCTGASLGLQVVQTSLAAMIQCFEWKVDGKNDTVDMEEKRASLLQKARPLICVPISRLSSLPSSI